MAEKLLGYWRGARGLKGDKGDPGESGNNPVNRMLWSGTWSPTAAYSQGDMVVKVDYDAAFNLSYFIQYRARNNITAPASGQQNQSPYTDSTNWTRTMVAGGNLVPEGFAAPDGSVLTMSAFQMQWLPPAFPSGGTNGQIPVRQADGTATWATGATKVAVPATATSPGVPGNYAVNATHVYHYTGNGTTHSWVRTTAGTW